jgi:uncharacterized protein YcfJ
MKTSAFTMALLAAAAVQAQEAAQVVSSTPIYQQVMVPRQVCSQTPVLVQPRNSGTGATLGALVGGAIGHQGGSGLGTVAGAIGGAMIGNQLENQGSARVQNQTSCYVQNVYENRIVGYNVVYQQGGRQFSVQTQQDPGAAIPPPSNRGYAPRPDMPPPNMGMGNPPPADHYMPPPRGGGVPSPFDQGAPSGPNMGWGGQPGAWR